MSDEPTAELFCEMLCALNDDERAVVLDVAMRSLRKVIAGRKKYGPMDLANDTRDWMEEQAQEADDLANYGAMARRQRALRGRP